MVFFEEGWQPSSYLQEKLKQLPALPGVYMMKDEEGRIIYVGKADSLKNRVRSYFQNVRRHEPKTAALVSRIADFETIVVNNTHEALILESTLIKLHRPHYNIRLQDDKRYPYLKLTTKEDFPRLLVSRVAKNDGNRYFGPYPHVTPMNQASSLIKKALRLRTCTTASWPANHRACLNWHIGLCYAPCEGKISKEKYGELVNQVAFILDGKTKDIRHSLEQEMLQASEDLNFEEAARLRDIIAALDDLWQKQQMEKAGKENNYDLIACAIKEDQCIIQVFFFRLGKVIGRGHFFLLNSSEGEEAQAMGRFILDYYGANLAPSRLFVSHIPPDVQELEAVLQEGVKHKVAIIQPQRGDKKRLLGIVKNNAQLVLDQSLNSKERKQSQAALGLENLRVVLGLKRSPSRIECYDISHFQGTNTVGSMVVFENGAASPKLYRHFRIKTVEGVNDFASLQEVLKRRWERGLKEKAEGKDPLDFGNFPDLLVIDGGKGQLSSVCEILEPLGFQGAAIISLAKEQEEVFVPGQSQSIDLPQDAPGSRILQQIRDEAHRFAITYHKKLRGKAQTHSLLEDIPGIGPKLRRRLIEVFGSLKGIKTASKEELLEVRGITKVRAESIYEFFHSENPDGGA